MPNEPKWMSELDELFAAANRSDAPGLIVGVALAGQPVYRRAWGLASVQHGVANLPTTRMRIASISKHFTSLACLLLVEDGRLDLDAPANRYLPELQALEVMPTLRQFMAHTSGYRCTLEMGTLANGAAVQPRGWPLLTMARQRGTQFIPGTAQLYCNGTYHLLSEVIERVSGVSYETFMKTRIFAPLGMHDTESVPDDGDMVPGMASPHVRTPDGRWQRPLGDAELRGDGGIVSSIDDMLRWISHLREPKIVGRESSWRQLLEPVTLSNGMRSTYTLGLKRHLYRGVEVIHHSGGLFGLNAQILTVPAYELDIVILVNGAPLRATELSRKVVDRVLGPERLKASGQLADGAACRHLTGQRFRGDSGLFMEFDEVDGKLAVAFFNLPPAPVLYDTGARLVAGFEDIGMGPYEIDKAQWSADVPDVLQVTVGGSIERLQRLANAPETVLPDWRGSYYCAELAAEARIGDRTLRLRGDYGASRDLTLIPYSASVFGVSEDAMAGARFVLCMDEDGFYVDSYRARRIRFERVGA